MRSYDFVIRLFTLHGQIVLKLPNVNHPAPIARMNQVQCLTPFEFLHLLTQFFPIKERNNATGWYPKYSRHYDNSHCATSKKKSLTRGNTTRNFMYRHLLTILSRRKRSTLLILISSMMSQNRSTTSCMVFSHSPCKTKKR